MATCPKCHYSWQSKATAAWITCPGCQRKFERPAPVVEVLREMQGLRTPCDICGRIRTDLTLCRIDGETTIVCAECLGVGDWG